MNKFKHIFKDGFNGKFKILLDKIVSKYENIHGRKNSIDNLQYIEYIEEFLKIKISWNNFIKLKRLKSDFVKKKFYKWCRLNVFEDAFKIMSKQYVKQNKPKTLIIDSTDIQNLYGHDKDYIDRSIKIKSKKSTKLSIIIDQNKKNMFSRYIKPKKS